MSNKSIVKSAGIIGSATLLSRILGFARDVIFAAFFGTGIYAQAFVVAFRIPNLLRDLVGEGATNAAVVPVLVEELTHKGKEQFWKLANILLNFLLIILAFLTLGGFLFSRQLVAVMAFGFIADPAKFEITVALTKAIFPYLILIGLTAYGMGILNSLKSFAAPAFGMSMLNISLIVCMLTWKRDIVALVVGVLLGGLLQVLILIPSLVKRGIVFNQRRIMHPKVKKIGRLLIPRIFGTGIYQLNVFTSTILASLSNIAGPGAVAALYFSNRIMQFPLAIFAHALAQAALPTISTHVATNDLEKFRKSINFQLRCIFFILLPASAGLIALATPITRTLLERGAFSVYSTTITASALFFYAFGLLSYGMIKILIGAFYSMQDTKTPVKIAAVSLFINIVFNIVLMFPLKVGGLALANSISGIFYATTLLVILKRRIGTLGEKKLLISFIKILVASICVGYFAFIFNGYLIRTLTVATAFVNAASLLITISSAILVYLIICYLLKVPEINEFKQWILRRK